MPPANSPAMASPTRSPPPGTDPDPRLHRLAPSPTRATQPDPLSYLSSPAPDLASTLYTQADEAADEANASFLRDSLESMDNPRPSEPQRRSQVDPQRDPRRPGQTEHSSAHTHTSSRPEARSQAQLDPADDIPRRERLQRVLARLNRMHDPTGTSTTAAYSDRTPSPNRQSLYDWAPAYAATRDIDELEAIQRELLRLHPDPQPELLRVLGQGRADGSRNREREAGGISAPVETGGLNERRERLLRERERRRRETEWVNLRTRAAMQRSRQGSPQSFDRMLRYVMDRERSGLSEEEDRARVSGWYGTEQTTERSGTETHRNETNSSSRDNYWLLPPPANANQARPPVPGDQRERIEAFRRGYLAENMPPRLPRLTTPPVPATGSNSNSTPAPFLENAIKYLDELRDCVRYEDALSAAIDHGLATKEFFADKHDDFVMDLGELTALPDSSWLQPGSTYEGHQHATNSYAALTHNPSNTTGHVVEQINPNYRTSNGASNASDRAHNSARSIPFDATRPWASHQFTPPNGSLSALSKQLDSSHDHWPVRVLIHAVDNRTMTLQGTMEAYDVPQALPTSTAGSNVERPKAGKRDDPITTYVEGHIIDSMTHSFLTPSKRALKKQGPHSTNSRNATPYTTLPNAIVFPAANASTDAANWRKLPPFNALPSDDETARLFLSRARMAEINRQYVFMRWKERCFVHSKDSQCAEADRHGDQDRGHGLTISGFYYISLRRSDGLIEGLYFDPSSTPVQHLRLKGRGMGWPSFELR